MFAHLPVGSVDIGNTQIDVRCHPPVEIDLAVAGTLARCPGPVVEKAQIQWLLHLVHTITDEEEHRRVRLPHRRISGTACFGESCQSRSPVHGYRALRALHILVPTAEPYTGSYRLFSRRCAE